MTAEATCSACGVLWDRLPWQDDCCDCCDAGKPHAWLLRGHLPEADATCKGCGGERHFTGGYTEKASYLDTQIIPRQVEQGVRGERRPATWRHYKGGRL